MKASELREMKPEELLKKENELREDVFRMRMKLATGELEDTSMIRRTKKDIARIKTILKEKEAEA
jgi:large subunit ribosomal protein L29